MSLNEPRAKRERLCELKEICTIAIQLLHTQPCHRRRPKESQSSVLAWQVPLNFSVNNQLLFINLATVADGRKVKS